MNEAGGLQWVLKRFRQRINSLLWRHHKLALQQGCVFHNSFFLFPKLGLKDIDNYNAALAELVGESFSVKVQSCTSKISYMC